MKKTFLKSLSTLLKKEKEQEIEKPPVERFAIGELDIKNSDILYDTLKKVQREELGLTDGSEIITENCNVEIAAFSVDGKAILKPIGYKGEKAGACIYYSNLLEESENHTEEIDSTIFIIPINDDVKEAVATYIKNQQSGKIPVMGEVEEGTFTSNPYMPGSMMYIEYERQITKIRKVR